MSGFEDVPGIMVLAATNYANRLDDALMRSGRFSRQINIDYPDKIERLALIEHYFKKISMPLKDVSYEDIVELTEYFTPADIKELSNESAILSVRKKMPALSLECINEAVNKNITKSIRNKDGDLDIHLVSAHEMGHVLAEVLLRKSYPIKVTSYSYGGAGGFTQSGFKLRGIQDKTSYLDEIKILLGGRAAEEVICHKITNGASNDLEKAKKIMKAYYETYMFENYDTTKLEQLILNNIQKCYNDVVELFKSKESLLLELTTALEKERVMYTKDIVSICFKEGIGGSIL
jgi:cell division protease FtsH